MDELLREMAGASKATKLQVLRGLMACVDQTTGKATRPFVLRLALGAEVEVAQSDVTKTVKALMAKM